MSRLFAAALALFPAIASAQGYEGAVVDLQYQRYDDGAGFEVDSIEGTLDASWRFGGFGVQAGLILGKEVDSSDNLNLDAYKGVALHLTTDVSDTLRLGALVAADNAFEDVYLVAAEALYLGGPLRVEGRIGDSFDNGTPFSLFEVEGAYTLGTAFSARARMHYSDYGADGFYRVFSLGAGYDLSDQTQVYADISRHTNDFGTSGDRYNGSLFNLGVRFDLGGGNTDRMFSYQPLN